MRLGNPREWQGETLSSDWIMHSKTKSPLDVADSLLGARPKRPLVQHVWHIDLALALRNGYAYIVHMNHPSKLPRQRTNLTLNPTTLDAARRLGINLSEAAERGLEAAIREAESALWLKENREALESSNAWVEANGLPLAGKRLF